MEGLIAVITYWFIKVLVIIGAVLAGAAITFLPWYVWTRSFIMKDESINPIVAMICFMLCVLQVLATLDLFIFGYVKECC